VALRQVYLSADRRGSSVRADAERLLARLRAADPKQDTARLGDPTMLPHALPLGPLAEVTRAFGSDFATKVDALEPGRWTGPIESPYGLHLVRVDERVAPSRPTLAEVRPLVERELVAERRRTQLQALYDRLLQKYTVTIDMPAPEKAAPTPASGGAVR
jgi:PPIC-type PPIASE domain